MKSTQEHRDKLRNLSSHLAKIHKLLLENQIEEYEKQHSQTLKPMDRLNLLLNDQSFAWMRALSQLIAIVDGTELQRDPVNEEQMAQVKRETFELMFEKKNVEFSEHYDRLCKVIPDLILQHGKLNVALKELSYTM